MCRALKVSKSGFYKWCVAKPSSRAQRGQRIRNAVKQVHQQSGGIYGSYKIAQQLQQDERRRRPCQRE
jgi:putative transposase